MNRREMYAVRLDTSLIDALRQLSTDTGVVQTEHVRIALTSYLKRKGYAVERQHDGRLTKRVEASS